jgi:hypothetical protein
MGRVASREWKKKKWARRAEKRRVVGCRETALLKYLLALVEGAKDGRRDDQAWAVRKGGGYLGLVMRMSVRNPSLGAEGRC